MRKLMIIAALLGVVLLAAREAGAINPQSSGETQAVAPGATAVLTFGPYTGGGDMPAGFSLWSGDAGAFWLRRAVSGESPSTGFDYQLAEKIPASATFAAWTPVDSAGSYYLVGEITAGTDSVFVQELLGGIGR